MTYADSTCECCNRQTELAGVASSSLGPISLAFCLECLRQHAEPRWLIESIIAEGNWRISLEGFWDYVHYYDNDDGEYYPASKLKPEEKK